MLPGRRIERAARTRTVEPGPAPPAVRSRGSMLPFHSSLSALPFRSPEKIITALDRYVCKPSVKNLSRMLRALATLGPANLLIRWAQAARYGGVGWKKKAKKHKGNKEKRIKN